MDFADPTHPKFPLQRFQLNLDDLVFRAFCTDDSGVLWYDKDGSAADCLALHQPLE
jgi:hypothetical protein